MLLSIRPTTWLTSAAVHAQMEHVYPASTPGCDGEGGTASNDSAASDNSTASEDGPGPASDDDSPASEDGSASEDVATSLFAPVCACCLAPR